MVGDEGLRFFATVRKPSGDILHREADRLDLLAWLALQGEARGTP